MYNCCGIAGCLYCSRQPGRPHQAEWHHLPSQHAVGTFLNCHCRLAEFILLFNLILFHSLFRVANSVCLSCSLFCSLLDLSTAGTTDPIPCENCLIEEEIYVHVMQFGNSSAIMEMPTGGSPLLVTCPLPKPAS